MKYEFEMDHKTFYLVSQRSYNSLTGRPEDQPILEYCKESGRCCFIEKWWWAAEKVPCDTISSLDELKEALAFKNKGGGYYEFDNYKVEVQNGYHGEKDIIRIPISNEEFFKFIGTLPRTSKLTQLWRRLVWFDPDVWFDRQGYTWKTNHNGASPHRITRLQLGTKVLTFFRKSFRLTERLTIPLGFSLMLSSHWHNPTTEMVKYGGKGTKETHIRKFRFFRLGFYRVKITPVELTKPKISGAAS